MAESHQLLGANALARTYYESAVFDCNFTEMTVILKYTNLLLQYGEDLRLRVHEEEGALCGVGDGVREEETRRENV